MNEDLDREVPPHTDREPGLDRESSTGTPRWVKVFAVAFVLVVILMVAMIVGGHGPGQHMQP
ncbi:MAG: hypothetical protein DLM67_23440 [Candidatus Nephthysia bennettiae]|uniref:Uncharacterized protein n=1 Tax=Candidatus Nephthysia bennettiae TaxID=3127016 RepID=A0A934N7N7_9BACT|nr:hypothetical protein [Candidatus Dormibacteraeota bacterium]MBJ7612115.1 hypothetical protein [Candidatus Dormibacteraeota bacterium]PZR86697.1 MAG: hypothetical protein DLM67_23440 [Candidatus Dormibacteraeota bacterium]